MFQQVGEVVILGSSREVGLFLARLCILLLETTLQVTKTLTNGMLVPLLFCLLSLLCVGMILIF